MGKNVVIIGTQWGDEGKGKLVDLLTENVEAVVRFQGGHNAGHTLEDRSDNSQQLGCVVAVRPSPRLTTAMQD